MLAALVLLSNALAAPSLLKGDLPSKAAVRSTERAFHCEPVDWRLLKEGEEEASFAVTLCDAEQILTIRQRGRAWGFHTDLELRTVAPRELGCTELAYELVDVETRRVRGCGAEAVYRDQGSRGWRRDQPEAPHLEVSSPLGLGQEPVLGDPAAPFVVVDYTDFGCAGCAASFSSLHQLTFDPKVQVRSRLFPQDGACNPEAAGTSRPILCEAAYAAICAHRQGHYWEYAASLYGQPLDEERLTRAASELGLDLEAFAACRVDPATKAAVRADVQSGAALGLARLPARYVLGLREQDWVETCVSPPQIAAMIRAAERGEVLPMSPAQSCAP